jgi:tetratricopeptide (TPR) repeat protein
MQKRFSKEESFARTDTHLIKRQYKMAINELESLLSIYPQDYEILKRRANVFYCMRDWERAAREYELLIAVKKEKEQVIRYYTCRKEMVQDDSLELSVLEKEIKEVAATFLEREKGREEALSIAYELFSMADTGTVALEPYREALVREFPNTKTAYEVIVNDFYNGIYPIWRDDTARVPYCEAFLEKYPETEWRFTVYQYLLSSLHRLKEYEKLLEMGEALLEEEANDPFAYNYVSYFLVEEERELKSAETYSRKAIALWEDYEKPKNLSEEQWKISRKMLYGDSRMALARALAMQGEYKEAKQWIDEAIDKTGFGVDDYRSNAPYFYLLGKILEETMRQDDAVVAYSQCLIEGDVNNTWCVKADSGLMNITGKVKKDIIAFVRRTVGYEGAVFVDITESIGFKDIKASRISWGDYNDDGFDDILLRGCRIFENLKGVAFEEVTERVGIGDCSGSGGIWGDWNNDGFLDFFTISGGKGEKGDRIWIQMDDGIFRDVTTEAGDVTNDFSTEGAAWGDANGDGFLELYLANYENWADHSYYPDGYYLGKSGNGFEEVLNDVGMVPPFNENKAGRGVNWGDFDNDGDLDIYVSNYRLQENFLWRNNGDGTFSNVACLLGVAGDEVEGWWGHTIGSSWADYDNDGDLDLITANLAHPRYIEFSNKTRLYENLGAPEWNFTDRRAKAGIKFEETHSDPAWADIDNDGDLDLYITSIYEGRKSFLYENLGNGTFRDITFLAGVRVFNGWGCAFSDFDCDGDMDLFVASGSGVHLFENSGAEGNYLKVRVKGNPSNSTGIGARITVRQGEKTQIREIQGGKGTTSQNSFVQHFGFGDDPSPATIEVRFMNGKKVVRSNVELNGLVEVSE